jgi:hypothetical protein
MVATFRGLANGRNLPFYAASTVAVELALLVETAYSASPLVGWPLWNNATHDVLTPTILAAVASFLTRAWGTDRLVRESMAMRRSRLACSIYSGRYFQKRIC